MNTKVAVTGAFGYSGKYIARRLIAQGKQVITLTGNPERANDFKGQIEAQPFNFDRPQALRRSLQGVDTLFNTYWVRFDHGDRTFSRAVANTRTLIRAAVEAGVRRLVHVSITNPSLDSPLPYFKGKAELEAEIQASKLSYAIIRPTVIFGREDILINNIAYLLRRFPLFATPGAGDYRLQPVYVEDMAQICTEAGAQDTNTIIDAVGPDIFTFNDLLRLIAQQIGSRARIFHVPSTVALGLSRVLGFWLKDVVLTRDEVEGLRANLLVSEKEPTGVTHLADWLAENADWVGKQYASEIARHYTKGK